MDDKTIKAILDVLEPDEMLDAEINLGRRLNVIDLVNYLSNHPRANYSDEAYQLADRRLQQFKDRLTAVNAGLYERLRTQIREGRRTPAQWRSEFDNYTSYRPQHASPQIGTDDLDTLFDSILNLQSNSYFSDALEADMVPYVPTPARVVLEAVDSLDLKPGDVFYDLGSGLGRVVILAHLISGVTAKGIEISPVLHEHACEFAERLAFSKVTFVNTDVRQADYTDGTVFFMYTPFTGEILRVVLDGLRRQAQTRPLRLCSYGPNTTRIAQEAWLQADTQDIFGLFKPVVFRSH